MTKPRTTTRARARDLGISFSGAPGEFNSITDVPGVLVGYQTLISGDGELIEGTGPVRTGVTAILPRGRTGVGQSVAAGTYSFNGNGEMTGTAWIEESGTFNTPILITNTHSVGACHEGSIAWMIANKPEAARAWMLPVVAETWDSYLNDINGLHVRPDHAVAAIDSAGSGPLDEGPVGGGTGMTCYGYTGGSGTSSRSVRVGGEEFTVGVFIQANFGERRELVVAGVPVGERLLEDNPIEDPDWFATAGSGSAIIIVATDAPLLPSQCKALARRVPLGLGRTGTTGSHFSGDLVLAFSIANQGALNSRMTDTCSPTARGIETLNSVAWGLIDRFYEATVQATEEAVINTLVAGRTTFGRDSHRMPGFPVNRLPELLGDRLETRTAVPAT
ncbi:P1 family peptidase [Arthrobacter sp. CDRTa11]|nr:P1 family peptidase [Arthrobacter sp. CDRTa11]